MDGWIDGSKKEKRKEEEEEEEQRLNEWEKTLN